MTRFYIGDAVKDSANGMFGLVVGLDAKFIDSDGQHHFWDYELLYEDDTVGFADDDELTYPEEDNNEV